MRAVWAVAALTAALCACSGATTPNASAAVPPTTVPPTTATRPSEDQQALECPTQPHVGIFQGRLPASFEIVADGGVSTSPEGQRLLSVVPPQPVVLTVLVTVEPDVVLERLWFDVQSVYWVVTWSQTAGTHLPEGRYEFELEIESTGWLPGRHPLRAGMLTEIDNRDPCLYRSGATWGPADIAYLVVDFDFD